MAFIKNLYFGKKKLSRPAVMTFKALSYTYVSLAPKGAVKNFSKLLMKPYSRRRYNFESIKSESEQTIPLLRGEVTLHKFGQSDKVVIVTHGWADNSKSFESLIHFLLQKDYEVWMFDHLGHGRSKGEEAHLFGFINGLETVVGQIPKEKTLKAIIGHSMGGLATLNVGAKLGGKVGLILIAMPTKFAENLYKNVASIGVHGKVLKRILDSLAKAYGKTFASLSVEANLKTLHHDTFVIHDKEDRYASCDNLMAVLPDDFKRKHITSGLGHHRILNSEDIHKVILKHLEEIPSVSH